MHKAADAAVALGWRRIPRQPSVAAGVGRVCHHVLHLFPPEQQQHQIGSASRASSLLEQVFAEQLYSVRQGSGVTRLLLTAQLLEIVKAPRLRMLGSTDRWMKPPWSCFSPGRPTRWCSRWLRAPVDSAAGFGQPRPSVGLPAPPAVVVAGGCSTVCWLIQRRHDSQSRPVSEDRQLLSSRVYAPHRFGAPAAAGAPHRRGAGTLTPP